MIGPNTFAEANHLRTYTAAFARAIMSLLPEIQKEPSPFNAEASWNKNGRV